MKIEELIENVSALQVFTREDDFAPVVEVRFKRELLEMLSEVAFDIKAKEVNDVSKIQLENKSKLIDIYKQRIEYLEDFIVRIARESKDL